MSDRNERDVERPYVVDGIREYDNPMPGWWLLLFYATIAFGGIYLAAYHVFDAPSLLDEFALVTARDAARQAAGGEGGKSQALAERLGDPALIAAGKETYLSTCAPCHGEAGQGVVGPNLTDAYWLHGGTPDEVASTVANGVTDKGMPAWGPILGQKKVDELVAFIFSLQGSAPANAKAPEGEQVQSPGSMGVER